MQISESKRDLFKSRQRMVEIIDELQKSAITRCVIEGCVYGYEGVHEMPNLDCIYCRRSKETLRDKGVRLNDWRSPGQTPAELIETAKKKREAKEHDEKYKIV